MPFESARRTIRALDALPLVETLAFVRRRLGVGPADVLEVGCGAGDLAAALAGHDKRVVALDASEVAVSRARERGVGAVHARWPDFDHAPVDAILFTRSLHHLEPLGPALDRAAELLVPGGHLLVEDFAFEEVDVPTLGWFHGALRVLDVAGLLDLREDSFVKRFLDGGGDLAAWRSEHPHALHSAETMQREIAKRFDLVEIEPAAYLYRYLAPVLAPTRTGFDILRGFLDLEIERIARGALTPIGRRFVALGRS